MVKKVIRNNEVAVIYSPGFGAGWYTWNQLIDNSEQLLFDPVIVQILETQSDNWLDQLLEYIGEEYPDAYIPPFMCVFEEDEDYHAGWYFFDECGEAHGPFETFEKAQEVLSKYEP